MEFDELQVVWNQQQDLPQFVVDPEALYARLEKTDIKTRRLQAFEEWMFSAMAAVVGILTISEPLLEHKEYHQVPIGAGFLLLSLFFLWTKVQRRKEEPEYDQSFLGIIDLSIVRLRRYCRWVKRAHIFFWIATSSGASVSLVLHHDSKPVWLWFGLLVMLAVTYFAVNKQMRVKQQRIESLISLRDKLSS